MTTSPARRAHRQFTQSRSKLPMSHRSKHSSPKPRRSNRCSLRCSSSARSPGHVEANCAPCAGAIWTGRLVSWPSNGVSTRQKVVAGERSRRRPTKSGASELDEVALEVLRRSQSPSRPIGRRPSPQGPTGCLHLLEVARGFRASQAGRRVEVRASRCQGCRRGYASPRASSLLGYPVDRRWPRRADGRRAPGPCRRCGDPAGVQPRPPGTRPRGGRSTRSLPWRMPEIGRCADTLVHRSPIRCASRACCDLCRSAIRHQREPSNTPVATSNSVVRPQLTSAGLPGSHM